MTHLSTQDTVTQLRTLGLSPSPQRVAIFDFLRRNPIHPNAETIFQEIRKTLPTISLTTVYNTLKVLSERRAIQEVIIEDGELRFDADMREHAHFKCTACGKVFDLFPAPERALIGEFPPIPTGFRIDEIHLCLKGCCAECNSQTPRA